eukprot:10425517-Alexandrium_andersonii.AAC.1
MVPEAPEGCVLHRCSRRSRIRPRNGYSRGSEVAKSRTPMHNPPIRNPRDPWLWTRERPDNSSRER